MEHDEEKLNKNIQNKDLVSDIGEMMDEKLERTENKLIGVMDEKLSNHPTKADLDERLSNHPTKADLDEKLSNHPTKADLDERLQQTRDELIKAFAEFTDETILPGVDKTVREIITDELRSYPTKVDLENALRDNRDEIIKEIRKKIEPMHRHQVVVTDVIEQRACAVPGQLEVLKESVS